MKGRFAGALLVVCLLAGCGHGSTGASAPPGSTQTPTPSSTSPASGATSRGAPTAPVSIRTFPATSGVPWSAIGPGWFLVGVDAPTTRLSLIDPHGRRFPVYTDPHGGLHVVGWSGDGQRVLLQALRPSWPSPTYVVDLRAGREWRPTLPPHVGVFGFTRPSGADLLTATQLSAVDSYPMHYRLERRDLYGGSAVTLSADLVDAGQQPRAVYVDSGATAVVGRGSGLALVSNATGQVIRMLPSSAGCAAIRMWDDSRVLEHCGKGLTLLSTNGGASRLLMRRHTQKGPDYDDADVWQLPSGLYTDSLGACGSEFLGHVESSGAVRPVPVPQTVGNTQPLTAWNGRLAIAAQRGCEGPDASSLLWFDPTTKAEQVLWSPRRGDRNVQFVTYQGADAAPLEAGLS